MELFRNLPEFMIPYKRNPYTQEMKDAAVKILDQGASMVGRMREEIFFEKEYAYHTNLRYVIRAPRRDALMEHLYKEGIGCTILYGKLPIYRQVYSKQLYGDKYQARDFPVTEKLKTEELALPEPRFRSQWELEYIAKKIKEFYS